MPNKAGVNENVFKWFLHCYTILHYKQIDVGISDNSYYWLWVGFGIYRIGTWLQWNTEVDVDIVVLVCPSVLL